MIEDADLNRRAFPVPHDQYNPITPGMTLREWYAGLALQGILADGGWKQANEQKVGSLESFVARCALAFADALLAELAKGGGNG